MALQKPAFSIILTQPPQNLNNTEITVLFNIIPACIAPGTIKGNKSRATLNRIRKHIIVISKVLRMAASEINFSKTCAIPERF